MKLATRRHIAGEKRQAVRNYLSYRPPQRDADEKNAAYQAAILPNAVPHSERETHMSKILVLAIGIAIATGVSAAQFTVDLWGIAYVAEKDTDDSAFRLDDNGCRRDVTTMVYADAVKGVDNKAEWTRTYIGCMEGKGYAVAPKKSE